MKKHANIPMVTNLVSPGDPRLKSKDKSKISGTLQVDELNQRIDELEIAIGQDKSGPIGRAFAIRAESNRSPNKNKNINIKNAPLKKNIDGVS